MAKKLFTIILPTFNESRNVAPILEAINVALRDFPHDHEILFVDDSNDDTPQVIRKHIRLYNNVRLLHREKHERTGLATAFVAGFEKANGDYILCMDSDLQHPPEEIPGMAKKAIDGANDVVVASRYIPGGSPEGLGGKYRVFVSRVVTRWSAWTILPPTSKSTDPGAGMFVVRKDLIDSLSFEKLYGFKILIDILTRAPEARVDEHPIVFKKRENEESKATLKQGLQFYKHLWHLFVLYRLPIILKKAIFYNVAAVIFAVSIFIIMQTDTILETFIVSLAIFLTLQSSFMIYLMVYAWENPKKIEENKSPSVFLEPRYSFAAFIPAFHEKDVIADTIRSAARLNYPDNMKEVVILINEPTDDGTIEIAQKAIAEIGKSNIRLLTFGGKAGKSEGLNIGLKHTDKDIITIFDAEDEIHPDILHIVNTTMIKYRVDIVQSGVQLMNFHSNWYSLFNVMEYYFWFKSVLHFFAANGMIPLGGNTVFFKRHWLNRVGGWDEKNLTEDADIGIRMSVAGARTKVVYDERHATQEETPPTVAGFIKQRTRWNQGFIQTLFKGQWLKFPKMRQKLLALYILTWLFFQGSLFVLLPLAIIGAFFIEMSPVLGIIVNLPLYTFIFLFVIVNIGLYEFTKSYSLKYTPLIILKSMVFYIPFQMLLGVSAFRAIIRQSFGDISWEKTTHINAARQTPVKQ